MDKLPGLISFGLSSEDWNKSITQHFDRLRVVVETEAENINKKKCAHCGQHGKKYTACNYCGAPIE